MKKILLTVVLPALVVLVLVAGGAFLAGRASTTSVAAVAVRGRATGHDAADVRFAQMMVPHHRQAVEMAGYAESRAGSDAVRRLAERIGDAQQPEIDTMDGWLIGWGEHVGSSTGGMSGMMSASDMTRLTKESGAAFDEDWLRMMVAHHAGAISMARTELESGRSSQALGLAASIVVTQQAEIAQMKAILDRG